MGRLLQVTVGLVMPEVILDLTHSSFSGHCDQLPDRIGLKVVLSQCLRGSVRGHLGLYCDWVGHVAKEAFHLMAAGSKERNREEGLSLEYRLQRRSPQ